jgi:hypothetical protein
LTAAEFMRRCTLGYPIAARQEDRMAEARLASALIRLGVNLNQIARHMNAGRSAPAYLEELILRIDRHLDELYGPRRP